MGVATKIPWWLKIGAKTILSRLPVPYAAWRRLRLFRHGDTNNPEHALRAFQAHYERAVVHFPVSAGFSCLELGPGDSLLTGVVARAFGAARVFLVDAGPFAERNLEPYRRVAQALAAVGRQVAEVAECTSFEQILDACRITYLTDGLQSLHAIESGSIDYFWSQVVLEHIPKSDFSTVLRELRRISSAAAVGSHSVDLRDHLGGSLNNLRFSDTIWESRFMCRSGFYTNRIRYREMLDMFKSSGFAAKVLRTTVWPQSPLDRRKMAAPYSALPDDDLRVAEFEVLLRPV